MAHLQSSGHRVRGTEFIGPVDVNFKGSIQTFRHHSCKKEKKLSRARNRINLMHLRHFYTTLLHHDVLKPRRE